MLCKVRCSCLGRRRHPNLHRHDPGSDFVTEINKYALYFLFLAIGCGITSVLETVLPVVVAARQVSTIRSKCEWPGMNSTSASWVRALSLPQTSPRSCARRWHGSIRTVRRQLCRHSQSRPPPSRPAWARSSRTPCATRRSSSRASSSASQPHGSSPSSSQRSHRYLPLRSRSSS